jgi:hypothetical protein
MSAPPVPYVHFGTTPFFLTITSQRQLLVVPVKERELVSQEWYLKTQAATPEVLQSNGTACAVIALDLYLRRGATPGEAFPSRVQYGDIVGVRCLSLELDPPQMLAPESGRLLKTTYKGYCTYSQTKRMANTGLNFDGENCFVIVPAGAPSMHSPYVVMGDSVQFQSREHPGCYLVPSAEGYMRRSSPLPPHLQQLPDSIPALCLTMPPAALVASLPLVSSRRTTVADSQDVSPLVAAVATPAVVAVAPAALQAMDDRYASNPDRLKHDLKTSGILDPSKMNTPEEKFMASAALAAAPAIQQSVNARYKDRPDLIAQDAQKAVKIGASVASNPAVQSFAKSMFSAAVNVAAVSAQENRRK